MKKIELRFNNASPSPALGYIIKYREVGTLTWNTIYPNPMSSPVEISDLPTGKKWEGTIQAVCSPTVLGGIRNWAIDDMLLAYIYGTNDLSTDGRGITVWFSMNDYYTPNNPSGLIAANTLGVDDLGLSPSIDIPMKFWRDDVSNTLDDGLGNIRVPDGERIVNPASDGLVFDVASGAWKKATGIFPEAIAPSIAAFRIDLPIIETYTEGDVTYSLKVADSETIIRVKNTFLAGATGVTFFDLQFS